MRRLSRSQPGVEEDRKRSKIVRDLRAKGAAGKIVKHQLQIRNSLLHLLYLLHFFGSESPFLSELRIFSKSFDVSSELEAPCLKLKSTFCSGPNLLLC
jgi:hypothetical protein